MNQLLFPVFEAESEAKAKDAYRKGIADALAIVEEYADPKWTINASVLGPVLQRLRESLNIR